MNFQSELEIRKQLVRYLNNECSLKEFEDWFVPRSWNFTAATSALQALVSEIELRLAEFSNGDWTVEELRNHFKPLVTTYVVEYRSDDQISIRTAASSNAQESLLPIGLWQPVDIRPAEASV